jgi:predicted Zn finger-like uncharacterized protein
MIVTCASCLTKFSLDESKIPIQGAKVRCSRCQHVFHVVPPLETSEEEVVENFESFAKSHEDVIEPGLKPTRVPPSKPSEEGKGSPVRKGKMAPVEKRGPELVDLLPVSEEASQLSEEEDAPFDHAEREPSKPLKQTEKGAVWEEEETVRSKPFRREEGSRRKKRTSSLFFALFVVLILLIFGAFYLWTALESSGKLGKALHAPIEKVTRLWDRLWNTERQGLVIQDLNGYQEKVGDVYLYVIEGKVNNQSRFTKKYIKVRVVILDQDKTEIAGQETFCGSTLGREDVKKLPPAFFQGEIVVKPQTEKEMVVPADKSVPFMVIFKDLASQAKEFKVQILEAPNL